MTHLGAKDEILQNVFNSWFVNICHERNFSTEANHKMKQNDPREVMWYQEWKNDQRSFFAAG